MDVPEVTTKDDWTMGSMAFQLPAAVEAYIVSRSIGHGPLVTALTDETSALGDPSVMMLAKEQYSLFRFLCALLGTRKALDIGTFTGLSALAFAEGVGPGGRVVTIDRTPAWVAIARRHWEALGVNERIDVHIGEALDVLRELAASSADPFDIAFIDVDKARIQDYFEATLSLLAPRGLIIVDNALWHGWVLDTSHRDEDTVGMRRFNDSIARDPRVEVVFVPIGDGISMIRRRN